MSRRQTVLPRLRRSEIPALLAATAVTVVVEAGLRTTTLPRLARALGTPLDLKGLAPYAGAAPYPLPRWAALRLDAARRVLGHSPFGDSCLRQALVCGCLVRRLRPVLQVGVAEVDGEVRAHAWLLVSGTVIDPRRAVSSYLPLVAARGTAAR